MFHLSDLLDAAGPAPWHAPGESPAEALLLRYRRRHLGTKPDDAPDLRLPDAQHLEALRSAVTSAENEVLAATAIGACFEAPVLAFASPPLDGKARRWSRLALVDDIDVAALLSLEGTVGKRATRVQAVRLQLCDLSDLDSVRQLVEQVYIEGDQPARFVRNRGRVTPPRAVWIGLAPDTPGEVLARLAAVAAGSGYLLEVIRDPIARMRPALQKIADAAPELILVWSPYVQPGEFTGKLMAMRLDAQIESIEETDIERVIEEARTWFSLAPVLAREPPPEPGAPSSMVEAAERARELCDHVEIADQAIRRAKRSSYEHPKEVLDAIIHLDRIIGQWTSREIEATEIEQACADLGLLYSRDISPEARARHGARYEVTVDGEPRGMGPHLRFGGSLNPRFCARVYWWADSVERRIVIGHIGEHLPGSKD